MPCGWEDNRRCGVALAMCHRLKWFIHLRVYGLRKGDEHPAYTPPFYISSAFVERSYKLHGHTTGISKLRHLLIKVNNGYIFLLSVYTIPRLSWKRGHWTGVCVYFVDKTPGIILPTSLTAFCLITALKHLLIIQTYLYFHIYYGTDIIANVFLFVPVCLFHD